MYAVFVCGCGASFALPCMVVFTHIALVGLCHCWAFRYKPIMLCSRHVSIFIFSPPPCLQVHILATWKYLGFIRCSVFYSSDLSACCFLCLEPSPPPPPPPEAVHLPCPAKSLSGLKSQLSHHFLWEVMCDLQSSLRQAANCDQDISLWLVYLLVLLGAQ